MPAQWTRSLSARADAKGMRGQESAARATHDEGRVLDVPLEGRRHPLDHSDLHATARNPHAPSAHAGRGPTRPPAQDVGGSHLFSMREIVLMMELMMTHTVKRSMAMPGLAVWPLPLTYGNRPACPDLLPAGSAPATPLLFGRGGREGRRDGTAGTGGRRAGRDRHPRCRRYVQYCRASGAKFGAGTAGAT